MHIVIISPVPPCHHYCNSSNNSNSIAAAGAVGTRRDAVVLALRRANNVVVVVDKQKALNADPSVRVRLRELEGPPGGREVGAWERVVGGEGHDCCNLRRSCSPRRLFNRNRNASRPLHNGLGSGGGPG